MNTSATAPETVSLGKNGPKVTPLGVGTWSWGDRLFWNYGKEYDQRQVQEAFQASVEAGITLFDTAEVYGTGDSEQLLGNFAKASDREIAIATKYFPLPWRVFPESVREAVSKSLERLQIESIPLYQVHTPFTFFMSQETLMKTLAEEVQKGRIQAVGVSNYSASQMREAQEHLAKYDIPLASNQVIYSLLNRKIESNGTFQTAQELGVKIIAYSPLAQGLLTGKYTGSEKPSGARALDPKFKSSGINKISPVIDNLQKLGEKYQKIPAQVALNWLITQGTIPIPGAKNANQAQQNAGALGWQLNSEDAQTLDQASQPWLTP
ncbi:aldo/keto reductase [Euhalothece natronophila Z-M001]|uniref:Aldo/keto reductase n=1 Tax=Euhalothece natronophila Z-M001 TaxID=522448 RepID=A0A5B8NN26_9CHRO|nr:aldo/keto reductase [Euhalothece natronophila]QDZ40357.1 aldo/keto reductase [Euhalothece natronophila Z-M001]